MNTLKTYNLVKQKTRLDFRYMYHSSENSISINEVYWYQEPSWFQMLKINNSYIPNIGISKERRKLNEMFILFYFHINVSDSISWKFYRISIINAEIVSYCSQCRKVHLLQKKFWRHGGEAAVYAIFMELIIPLFRLKDCWSTHM